MFIDSCSNKSALAQLGQLLSTLPLNCYPWNQLKHKATKRLIEIRMLGHFSFKQNRWLSLPHFCQTWGGMIKNAFLTLTHAHLFLKGIIHSYWNAGAGIFWNRARFPLFWRFKKNTNWDIQYWQFELTFGIFILIFTYFNSFFTFGIGNPHIQ